MTEALPDTRHSRDLPVLRSIAAQLEGRSLYGYATISQVAEDLSLNDDDVQRAIRALEGEGLIRRHENPGLFGRVVGMSGEARRLVGLWPTAETALDRMIAALEAIAENTEDDDTRSRARKILDGLTGASRTIGLSVATAAITGQIPGS